MVVREKQTGSAAMSTLVPATITKTARLYTDLGLFSCRFVMFNYLTFTAAVLSPAVGCAGEYARSHAPHEIEHCQNGFPGRIVAKMNALVDQIIATLYLTRRGAD